MEDRLPPLHSTLFQGFQVVDLQLHEGSDPSGSRNTTQSYIDFGSGSDKSNFTAVHRFSINRSIGNVDQDDKATSTPTDWIQITHSCLACNPSQNKAIKPDILFPLHKFYAMLLFREGVAQVLLVKS